MRLISELKLLTDHEVLDRCLSGALNFAMYRLPDARSARLIVSEIVSDEINTPCSAGFVIAPFADSSRAIFIPCRYERTLDYSDAIGPAQAEIDIPACSDPSYIEAVERLRVILKERGGKTVFSYRFNARMNPGQIFSCFQRLCTAYPSAYIYCWHLAESGEIWIGASPELLLANDGTSLHTVSLAGTRPATASQDASWDEKNIEEQALVTDYIVSLFRDFGLNPVYGAPVSRRAGHIEHLCTQISAALPYGFKPMQVAEALSPTPAVCGTDKDFSIDYIHRFESGPRRYYGGYSGPVYPDGTFSFYVTLRCASLSAAGGSAVVYAGGGITHASVPENEWCEICAKARTLSNIFKV